MRTLFVLAVPFVVLLAFWIMYSVNNRKIVPAYRGIAYGALRDDELRGIIESSTESSNTKYLAQKEYSRRYPGEHKRG